MRKSGFTLLEMIIALVIIGVLAVLSVGGYKTLVEKSKSAEAIAKAGQIRKAEIVYKLEKGEFVATENSTQLREV